MIDEINTVARTSRQEKEDKIIATIASKVAQNDNEESMETVTGLIDRLLSTQNPFEYDFEKPIAIKMTKYDIERKFSRK